MPSANVFDLTGKVAIVTGSTKGIGRAMVEGLSAAGASVVVSSRKQELCDQVADEIRAATGSEVLGLACHVGGLGRHPRLRREGRRAVRSHRRAGQQRRHQPRPGDGRRDDPRLLAQGVLGEPRGPAAHEPAGRPVMRDGGGGSIVHIGTMAAYGPGPNICAYGASKAGLQEPDPGDGHGVGRLEDPGEHPQPRPVHERDARRRRRPQRDRLPRHGLGRHVAQSGSPTRRRSSARCSTSPATPPRTSPPTTSRCPAG